MAIAPIIGLTEFCERVCCVDGETGEIPDGYVRIRAGDTKKTATGIGKKWQRPNDARALESEIALNIAASVRHYKVFSIEWIARKGTNPDDECPLYHSEEYESTETGLAVVDEEDKRDKGATGQLASALSGIAIYGMKVIQQKDRDLAAKEQEIRALEREVTKLEFDVEMLRTGAGVMKLREVKEMVASGVTEAGKHAPEAFKLLSEYMEVQRLFAVHQALKDGVKAEDLRRGATAAPAAGDAPATDGGVDHGAALDAHIDAIYATLGEHKELATMERGLKLQAFGQSFKAIFFGVDLKVCESCGCLHA